VGGGSVGGGSVGGMGAASTVIAAVAFWLPFLAVIVADPAATPFTRPDPLTVAMEELLELHFDPADADSCTVAPTVTEAELGVMFMRTDARRMDAFPSPQEGRGMAKKASVGETLR
jgi:hypothetical protein